MGDIKVQRGTAAIGNAGGTVAPGTDFGSLASSFVRLTNNRRTHAGDDAQTVANREGDDVSGMVELTAVDTIEFTRIATSLAVNMRFAWESWEYTGAASGAHEFIVRGRATLTLTGQTTTATISGITDIDRCIPFITGIMTSSTADDEDSRTAIAWMSGTDTLNIKRGSNSNNTVTVQVVVVEFTGSSWDVKHGRVENNADSGTITLVDDADGLTAGGGDVGDWSNALIIHQFKKNDLNGVDDSLADTSAVYEPGSNTTSVDFLFHANHVDSAGVGLRDEHFVHVLVNSDMTVTRVSNTSNVTGANNVSIAAAGLTALDEASVEVSRSSSGNGTAYMRGWVNARLTSLTNCELWVHRSGNTIATRIQVADISGLTSGGMTIQLAATSDTSFEGDASLGLSTGLSATSDTSFDGSADLTLALGLQLSATSDTSFEGDASLGLATQLAATSDTSFDGSADLTLDVSLQLSATSDTSFEGDASLDLSTVISATSDTSFEGDAAVSLGAGLNATSDTSFDGSADLSLDSSLQLSATSDTSFEGDAAVSLSTGLNATSDTTFEGSANLSLGTELQLSATSDTSFEGDALLALGTSVSASSDTTFDGSAFLSLSYGLSATSDTSFEGQANLSLDSTLQLSATADVLFEGDASLDLATQLASTSDTSFEGDALLSLRYGLTSISDTSFEGDADLTLELSLPLAATSDTSFEGDADLSFLGAVASGVEFRAIVHGVSAYAKHEDARSHYSFNGLKELHEDAKKVRLRGGSAKRKVDT